MQQGSVRISSSLHLYQFHLHPDSSDKILNHLAEEAIHVDKLKLMRQYRQSLQNGCIRNGAVCFLKNTSDLVLFSRDSGPIKSEHGKRIQQQQSIPVGFKTGDEAYVLI